MPLPDNFTEAVRNLPKAAPQRKGREQTPEQKTRRADGQRRYQDQQKQQRGTAERAHRPDGEAKPATKNFRRNRNGVGAHKGAVQKTGGR